MFPWINWTTIYDIYVVRSLFIWFFSSLFWGRKKNHKILTKITEISEEKKTTQCWLNEFMWKNFSLTKFNSQNTATKCTGIAFNYYYTHTYTYLYQSNKCVFFWIRVRLTQNHIECILISGCRGNRYWFD